MVFVKRLGKQTLNGRTDEFWFWADEEKMVACYATKAELSILFQKRFNAEPMEMMQFGVARNAWVSFRISANDGFIVLNKA